MRDGAEHEKRAEMAHFSCPEVVGDGKDPKHVEHALMGMFLVFGMPLFSAHPL